MKFLKFLFRCYMLGWVIVLMFTLLLILFNHSIISLNVKIQIDRYEWLINNFIILLIGMSTSLLKE